ncbi:MAG: hypothetical protein JWO90_2732 [Solirubrobacterales bacterium]|nr:hypothetical protein [Solirubrobacterales bacterium]
MATREQPVVALRDVEKAYGTVQALRGVSFEIHAGEVIGMVGANGAGKSTLNKVISGQTAPTGGELLVDGEPVNFAHPREALAAGIALVPQELSLIEDRSVAENLFLGRMPKRLGFVLDGELQAQSRAALARVGLDDIDPTVPASELTPVEQRLVTIAEAISKQPRVLILDEPSAALPAETAARLEPIIRSLAADGTAVIYVSHRLAEIQRLAHRVFAMRDGRHAGDLAREEITIDAMVQLVGGSALREEPRPVVKTRADAPVVVRSRGLGGTLVHDADLQLHRGEIIGIGGLQGSGRSELLRLIGGIQGRSAGDVDVLGGGALETPHAAVRRGVGYVPEGRKAMTFPTMSVAANSTIALITDISRMRTFVDVGRERELAGGIAERVRMVGDLDAPITTLSGGNQQKACISRWLLKGVKLLLLDEPTVGIDVHARAGIHQLLRELAAEGTTIVVACSEPEELVLLCHRVFVMVEGGVAAELEAPFNVEQVVAASYAR